ncbi:MAG: hypothetical protein ACRC9L_08765 [Brevinema sp.]
MKKLVLCLGIFLAACGSSPTKVWLIEYEQLLKEATSIIQEAPSSPQAEEMRLKLSQKESEINGLLKNASMQDQMSFLSEYYDMRVKFFYQMKAE